MVGCVSVRIVVQSTDSFLTKVGGFEDVPESAKSVSATRQLLSEFHVERTQTFWHCELRDHGEYGVTPSRPPTR